MSGSLAGCSAALLNWIVSISVSSLLFVGWQACLAQQSERQQAEILEQQGKFAEAEAIWTSLSSANPLDPGPLAHIGILEARQSHYEAAVKNYNRALSLSPNLPGLKVDLGLAYFKMGDDRQALQVLKPLAIADPNDQRLTIIVGMAYYGLGLYKEAVPYLSRATNLDPGNLELLLDLGHSCLLSHALPCVQDVYNRIYAVAPNSVEAHMLKGETFDEAKDTLGAIQEFQAAVAVNPTQPNVHFGLGYLLWTQKHYADAATQFEAELNNDPGHLQSRLYLADADIQLSKFEDGRRLLEALIRTNERIAMAHLDLGIIYSETNRSAEAIEELKKAVALDPSDVSAHWRLARLYQAQGEKSQAAHEFAITKNLNDTELKTLSDVMSNKPQGGSRGESESQPLRKSRESGDR